MVIITASDVAPSLTDVGMVYGRYEGQKIIDDLHIFLILHLLGKVYTKNSVVHESA